MYCSKTVQSGSFALHARREIEDTELRKDWIKGDLIYNEGISLQKPLHDRRRMLKQSELQITKHEKLLSPSSKWISSQK